MVEFEVAATAYIVGSVITAFFVFNWRRRIERKIDDIRRHFDKP